MKQTLPTLAITSALFIVSAAPAQSINIDFGSAGTPDNTFGAAGQAGFWNGVNPSPGVPVALAGLDGSATNATLTTHQSTLSISDDQLAGNDEALMEDGLMGNGDVVTWLTINGLDNGTYEITAYGWTPTRPQDTTSIIPPEGITAIQPLGGDWPGGYISGVTHGSFEVEITDGELRLDYVGSFIGSQGFLNALQLERIDTPVFAPADLNHSGAVDVSDLMLLLAQWTTEGHGCDGINNGCPADLNGDHSVNTLDLFILLGSWG